MFLLGTLRKPEETKLGIIPLEHPFLKDSISTDLPKSRMLVTTSTRPRNLGHEGKLSQNIRLGNWGYNLTYRGNPIYNW